MAKRALLVGIASFAEKQFPPIPFADEDALKLKDALLRIGYACADITLLTSEEATFDAVSYALQQVCAGAGTDDEVILYLSGHGVAYNGANHFVCHDTAQAAPPAKALATRELLEEIGNCRANKLLIFLDCCHAGLKLPDKQVKGGMFSRFSEAEFERFFAQQKFMGAFCSCAENEISYTSNSLRQSVWTYYLLKALNGEVPEVLEEKRYLNGAKLQDYLYEQIPAAVRKLASYTTTQTPVLLSNWGHSPLIVDLQAVIAANADARAVAARNARLNFLNSKRQRISSLKGFRGSNQSSVEDDEKMSDVVGWAAKPELAKLRSESFDACRRMGYKIAEIDQSGKHADIKTPHFDLDFWAEQLGDSDEWCEVCLLATITDESGLEKPKIERYFSESFESVRLRASQTLDLRRMAILLEELDYVERVRIDHAYTHCSFFVPADSIEVSVQPNEVRFQCEVFGVIQLSEKVRWLLGRLAFDGVDLPRGEPARPSKFPTH